VIDRYSLPRMTAIWDGQSKFDRWLRIEILACEALAEMGQIPAEALACIQEKAACDISRRVCIGIKRGSEK